MTNPVDEAMSRLRWGVQKEIEGVGFDGIIASVEIEGRWLFYDYAPVTGFLPICDVLDALNDNMRRQIERHFAGRVEA